MYARFHTARRRLAVKLVHSRKISGQTKSEHIAPLGSILLPEPFSLSERIRFWEALEGRLRLVVARIGDRFNDDVRRNVIAGIDRRIPRPTEAEEISAAVDAARLAAERRGKRADRRAPSRAGAPP